MTLEEFLDKMGLVEDAWGIAGWRHNDDMLPCFAHRFKVTDAVNTPALIKEYIKHASNDSDNDVIVFSVTERDDCWNVWKAFAKAHPKTFKVVQGGSIHGKYQCRMYIYTKPAAKRKFSPATVAKYRAR